MSCGQDVAVSMDEQQLRPRHIAVVRVTHWIVVLSVVSLLISGIAILIAHPRLYWGETGSLGTPSLIDLPLPLIKGPSGWGRYLHFLSAWILVLTGLTYVLAGVVTKHIQTNLLPPRADLGWKTIMGVIWDHARWKRTSADEVWRYNVVQRLTYLAVVFGLFPAIVWTGLAMSPALTSVFPALVTMLGGHQSARTLHFVFVNVLVFFLLVHIAMLVLVGFGNHVRAMITGYVPSGRKP